MGRGNRPVWVRWVVGLASLFLVVGAVPARAAFPGANGLLVVQPANGRGLLAVGADGAHPRQICTVARRCDPAKDPVWSPDGSEIAYVSSQSFSGPDVIYPDGSCLACEVPGPWVPGDYNAFWDRKVGPGFLPDGRLAVSVDGNPTGRQLGAMNTDGTGFGSFDGVSGSWQQLAWSPTGQLAAIRLVKGKSELFVIDPVTGSTRQLTHDGASSPNWSPDSRRLAIVHDGWIELIGSGGGPVWRLTRGGAPAWAPDGKELAFVGADDRLFVISVRGGTPRTVGHIRALSVDWQPITGNPPRHCQAPAGANVVAASPDATIAIDNGPPQSSGGPALSVLGCLTSDGRERLLEFLWDRSIEGGGHFGPAVVAGDYAAVVNEATDLHYGDSLNTVAVFDLRTGAMMNRRIVEFGGAYLASSFGTAVCNQSPASLALCGESSGCLEVPRFCSSGIDQLVLSSNGATAAHTFVLKEELGTSCTSVEQIVANDSTGVRILDSITTTTPCASPPPALELSQLTLSGNTLTWSHAGTPESAQLN